MKSPFATTGQAATALLCALMAAQPVTGLFWSVTTNYMRSTSLSTRGTSYTYTSTTSYRIKDGVTPTVTPVSTRTYSDTYDDLFEMTVYYPQGAVAETDLVLTTSTTSTRSNFYATTYFAIPAVYTAPASCPTPFTYTTYTTVRYPTEVHDQIQATATATSTYTRSSTGYGTTEYVTKFINPTQYPVTRTPGTTDYIYTYSIARCLNPNDRSSNGGGGGGGGGSGGGGYYDDDDILCSAISGCLGVPVWVIVIATVLPFLFLMGFLESFLWFRALMTGKMALRVGTISWCLLMPLLLAVTRRSRGRSLEDQARLRAQWNDMSGGTKFKLWWRHGFKWAYPTELLGPDPKYPDGPGGDAAVMQGPPPSMSGGGPMGFVPAYMQVGQMNGPNGAAPGQYMAYQPYQYGPYDPSKMPPPQQAHSMPPAGQTPPPGQAYMPPQGPESYMAHNGAPHDQARTVSPPVSSVHPHETSTSTPSVPPAQPEATTSTTAPAAAPVTAAAPPSELGNDPKGKGVER